jgi:hypothetical protein
LYTFAPDFNSVNIQGFNCVNVNCLPDVFSVSHLKMKLRNSIVISVFSICLLMVHVRCEREELQPPPPTEPIDSTITWTTYTIPAGEHFVLQNSYPKLDSAILHFDLTFDSSAIYTSVLPENQFDWNKVIGFSDCSTHHHQNSLRLGWRWNPTIGIQLATYKYVNGVRSFQIVDTVQVFDTVNVFLEKMGSTYHTRINSKVVIEPRGCSEINESYLLLPYFGGDETAPDTIKIYIKWREI